MLFYKTEILFVFKDLFWGHMIEYLSTIDKALGLYPEHIGKNWQFKVNMNENILLRIMPLLMENKKHFILISPKLIIKFINRNINWIGKIIKLKSRIGKMILRNNSLGLCIRIY